MHIPNGRPVWTLLFKGRIWRIVAFYIGVVAITAFLLIRLDKLVNAVGSIEYAGHSMTVLALGALAYTLGLQHALEADHIAAIDNSVRKLVQEGKNADFAGLFFALGHATVVILVTIALMFSAQVVELLIPRLEDIGSLVGLVISSGFLYIIGLLNLLVFFETYRIFKRMKKDELDRERLNELLFKRGFVGRYFGGLFKIVDRQYYLYPIGFLFGLGFETASQTALLTLSVIISATIKIAFQELLIFPLLFTIGMVLVDTTNSLFMSSAYGWALSDPLRKLWYNLTTTIISVIIAWAIGTLEILALIQDKFNLSGPIWDWIAITNEVWWSNIGIIIIAIFAIIWIISFIIYKFKIKRI